MPLYFAYGSNMDRAAMAGRCPASRAIGPARLARHRFLVMSEGYATVVRDPRRTVWGLLWELALPDVPALDRYESLHTGLYAKVVQPVLTERGPRQAIVYVARSARPGYDGSRSRSSSTASSSTTRAVPQSLTRWLLA